MKNLKQQKVKFLTTRINSLKKELVLAKDIFNDAHSEIEKMFTDKYFPEKATQKPQTKDITTESQQPQQEESEFTEEPTEHENTKEDPESSPGQPKSSELKKMYKTIARKTHPDTCQDASEFEKERKAFLFNLAKQAYEENDFSGLIEVYKELDIELPDLPDNAVIEMEQQVIALQNEIHGLHSTYVWSWAFASSPEQQDNLLKEIFKRMHDYIRA